MLKIKGYFRKMEDAVNAFFGRFQFLFNFATENFVVIKDWRLGLVLRLLQIAILIYVLNDIIIKGSYLMQEIPKGTVNPSADVSSRQRKDSVIDQRKKYKAQELEYCVDGGRKYAYTYNGVEYKDFQCVVMDSLAIPAIGEMEFFITTYLRLDKLYYVDIPRTRNSCPSPQNIPEVPDNASPLGYIYGVCLYNTFEQYFPMSSEEIPLEILHSYYTSIVDANGALPETIITASNFKDGEFRTKRDQPIRLDLQKLLEIAGINLDKRLDDQPNKNGLSETAKDANAEKFPYARLSGVDIVMRFKYFHRSLAPKKYLVSAGPKTRDVICIIDLMPLKVWSMQGSDVHYQITSADHPFIINPEKTRRTTGPPFQYEAVQVDFQRHGVKLSFQVSGNMGRFNFIFLVNALVAGAVLLGVSQVVVTYVALYALGLSSKLYAEFMRESVNWRKEYARFATQSLVAGNTFMAFDTNKSGTLDRKEIYQYLSNTFNEILDPPKLACLTDFLMRHGEMDADVSKGRLDDASDVKISTINMAEWVDIFTAEKVQINSLSRLIESEYDNPKLVGILLGLAEGRLGRNLSNLRSGDYVTLASEESELRRRLLSDQEEIEGGDQPDIGKFIV